MSSTTTQIATRVFVVAVKGLFADALSSLINSHPDLEVTMKADTAAMFTDEYPRVTTDVVLFLGDLPDSTAIASLERLSQAGKHPPAVLVVANADADLLRRTMALPVIGCCSESVSASQLLDAIRHVAGGGRWVDQELVLLAISEPRNPLCAREKEVLRLVAAGFPSKEIARQLGLSLGTVRNYISRVLFKLNAHSKIEAIRLAHEQKWI